MAAAIWIAVKHWLPITNWGSFVGVGLLAVAPFVAVVLYLEPDFRHLVVSLWQRAEAFLTVSSRSRAKRATAEKD